VPKQGPYVDPKATLLKDFIDALDVLNDVVGGVYEEARDHAIPLLCLLLENFDEFSGNHGEIV